MKLKFKKNIDLTEGNLFKNLFYLSIPIMISNFIQTFYNLTDAFWLGKLQENASGAVAVAGLAFPIIFFISSFGFGFVVAGTSLVSQYRGAGKLDKIKEVSGQFVLLLSIFIVFFLFVSFFLVDEILVLLNTPDVVFESAREYISIIMPGMIFMFIFMVYQSFSHALGDTVSPMKIQFISVGINVVLDPLLIFGIGFFPELGIVGAAYCTLFSRGVAAIIAVIYVYKKIPIIIPTKKDMKPNSKMLKTILSISIPSSLAQSMTSFGFLFLQGFVNTYGVAVMSVHSIGNRMISFFMMPAMGISNALATSVGQNLGAKKIDRAEKSVKISFNFVMLIMGFGGIVLFFFGDILTKIFINDPEIIEIGARMFKITSVSAFIFGVLFVMNGVFNGAGHTKPVLIFNVSRLWLFRIPLVFLLSGSVLNFAYLKNLSEDSLINSFLLYLAEPLKNTPYDALWWSMLISNIFASLMAYSIYKKGKWKEGTI